MEIQFEYRQLFLEDRRNTLIDCWRETRSQIVIGRHPQREAEVSGLMVLRRLIEKIGIADGVGAQREL